MSVAGHYGADPIRCEEYGYGLGDRNGILVLRYTSAAHLEFGKTRQDFLHQFYWSPDGVLAAWHGGDARFVGPREVYWAHQAVTHEVRAGDSQSVYRVFLREVPPSLAGLRAGAVPINPEAAGLVRELTVPGTTVRRALAARARVMSGLGPPADTEPASGSRGAGTGTGYAMHVARALSGDLSSPDGLTEWAERLHISVKTLQRDFVREFGMPYSRWRSLLRLRASHLLLETHSVAEVAHRVGYATPSAFITAFTRQYGCTPGRRRSVASTGGVFSDSLRSHGVRGVTP
ncbi:AraC family transcriptional regulator [Spongiactinospora sp. TRM90649]|uniref:helix-turn-helix domain-containing protein n=1 Tax=Spongiactinospora sp. TRM90649 TaxID=3031114 RepID=UPI0023F79729|nr:AraC family transcriptional regulator [Spongiactinospora sp. TRM90649]MDF5758362.1 AraC family transcriptional regulator [Spongiactinospora sp. TRM90649]